MTQVFTEDGIRVPVTVIEAEPNTVTAVRIPDRDGYAAIQLAGDPGRRSASSTSPSSVTSRRPAPAPRRSSSSSATRPPRRRSATRSRSSSSSPASRSRSRRRRSARASRARSSATTSLAAPSPTARTTSAPPARSAPAPTPPASSRARRCRAAWVASASPSAASRSSRSTSSAICCCFAARSPAPRAGPWRCAPMAEQGAQGDDARQAGEDRPAGDRLRRGLPREPRPRGRARRPGRSPSRHRVEPRSRRGLDDRRQGVEAEGHRPRSRRRAQRPASPRRRRRLRPEAALTHLQGQPQGAPARAALGVLGPRDARQRRGARCGRLRDALDEDRCRGARQVGRQGSDADPLRSRRARRRQELSQPAEGATCCRSARPASPTSSATPH